MYGGFVTEEPQQINQALHNQREFKTAIWQAARYVRDMT